ncbi:MAG: glycoside hydrolase family 15 protein [Gemmatimonadaceae bacterium]
MSSEAEKREQLRPQHQILRSVECTAGEIAIDIVYAPRPDYARAIPRLESRGSLGVRCEHAGDMLTLRSEIPLAVSGDRTEARGRAVLRNGDLRYLALAFSAGEPAVLPQLGRAAGAQIATSIQWWERWAAACTYRGPYRDAVLRSALVLKLMAYAPSGAIIAAPTTSLPEWPGGVRNWDYRYCWLRDASFTLQVLADIGYPEEASAFFSWLLHATRITWPSLQILYDVYGEPGVEEEELTHLAGYAGSRPVRIGNAAEKQLQLDVYGEVLDAAYQYVVRGGAMDRSTTRMLVGFGETVCRRWREPDEGIWEVRSGPRHNTYSKAMCWVALDRLLKLHESGRLRLDAARFAAERDAIRVEVETRGYNAEIGSYVSVLDGDTVDASLLRLARLGYADPKSPRMRATQEVVRRRLGRNGLIYRYLPVGDDGLPPGEGAYGITSFWAADAQALAGDVAGAEATFERVLAYANDVGLFAEQIDPENGTALGNFPQAFTHVGLVDAALTLARARS